MNSRALSFARVLSSRKPTPVVIGFFLLFYAGIAFVTDEALVTLMGLTRRSPLLVSLLLVIPFNISARLAREILWSVRRRRAMNGESPDAALNLFTEGLDLPGTAITGKLAGRLEAAGYTVRCGEKVVSARRGISTFSSRVLFLAGTACLFLGIVLSLTGRRVVRDMVVEGEPLPRVTAGINRVERIVMREMPKGLILDKSLAIELTEQRGAEVKRKEFGLYPPALYQGFFVYPRYLGVAPLIQFAAPDLQSGIDSYYLLMIYPPGKEDTAAIPGSPYAIVVSLAGDPLGKDPYMTGAFTLQYKILNGKKQLYSGSLPLGGEFAKDGYRLGFPDAKRIVATDFIRDAGVPFIWAAALLLSVALVCYLPARLFNPRREMLFFATPTVIHAASRAEGKRREHAGVFHEALDLLAAQNTSATDEWIAVKQ